LFPQGRFPEDQSNGKVKMRVGVIGSGALGLYYGAFLQKSGHDVHFLLRRDYQAISRAGLKVTSPHGDFHLAEVNGYQNSQEIGPVDLVLIGLKAYANDHLAELTRPLIAAETTILTLQNGLGNEEILTAAFGEKHVVGGVAFLCCNRGEPGVVHHLDQGSIRIAEFTKGLSTRVKQLAECFNRAGIPCEAGSDLTRIRWEKLVWNIPFNGLCALTGLPTDRLLACPETRQLIREMMQEVITAANLQGLSEPIEEAGLIERMLQVTAGMGAYRPSMMVDRQQSSPLELTAIYGIPLERAAKTATSMPRVAMLYALLEATEQKEPPQS
jgi:2-dehydropantoate 2-reductase